ncbi:hypothetical protein [Pseudomonas chlororaphis]|jgi:hypothetical protein|uniref:Uncharacterized protein n=1 Tax=Pseudomonas chlororaphis subsp. aureofaciens TaxID=587851 RepID=A0AAD0ZL13_9PSED|nr:hypothetical protein [Pseudomonas chlororaphis]AZE27631.1 hypothetical protein C4K07_0824 [Pseudomonas chlororaphis subsp. aureofaciens]
MEMDWASLLDELWGHASSDPAEFEAKIRACLNGYSSEGLLQATTLLITQKQHATARTLLSEFFRSHQAADDIKRRLELILHFKQSRTPQTLSLKSKQRSKEILLKDVNDLVASGNLRAAETILLEANESIEEPDYLSLLGRIYMLQQRPLDAAKAIKGELLLRRQQRAFVETAPVESEDDDLPRASDLAYLNDSATSLATLGPSSATIGQTSSVEVESSLNFSQQTTAQFPPLNQEGWWENHVELASKESSTLADEIDAVDELETSPAATDDSEERANEDETTSPTPKKSILKLAMPRKITSPGETQASVHVFKKSGRSLGVIHTLSSSSLEADTDAVPAHSDLSPLSEPLVASLRIHDDILDEHDDDLPHAYPELGAPYLVQMGLGLEEPEDDIDFDHDLHDLTIIELGKEHEGDTSTVLDDFRDLDDDYAAYAFDPDEVFDSQEAVDIECSDWLADTLSREDRALQKAAELIVNANWPLSTLPLVQQIFVISGWGATRLALEREIEKGLTPEELILAAHIKVMWADNDIYWIAFDKTGSSRLSYYVLSWPTALLIVRSFESLPQVEEIEVFLENLFTSWYENYTLRRVFKAFARYVWFRFANLEGCLPANQHFDFCDPRELPAEEYSDLGLCDTLDIEKTERLRGFGVYQNKHPQEPSCYFSDKPLIIEEELSLDASGKRKRGETGPDATEPGLKSEDDTSRVDDVVDDEDAPQWSGALLASALNTQTTDQPSPSIES